MPKMGNKEEPPLEAEKGQPTMVSYYLVVTKQYEEKKEEKSSKTEEENIL